MSSKEMNSNQVLSKFIAKFLTTPVKGNSGKRNITYVEDSINRLLVKSNLIQEELGYETYVKAFRDNNFKIIDELGITVDRKGNKFPAISIKLYASEIKMLRLLTSGNQNKAGIKKQRDLYKLKAKLEQFIQENTGQ